MYFKWTLVTVWWHLLSLSSSAPRVRLVRQTPQTPEVLKLITGSREGFCDPVSDEKNCTRVVFTMGRSFTGTREVICNFVPTLFTDGSSGQERANLMSDTIGKVLPAQEVPEVHCPAPSLPADTFTKQSTAVQYQIRLRYTDQATLTQPYTLVIYHVPCVEKDDSSGQPTFNVMENNCVIDGVCVKESAVNGNNPAQTCVSSEDKFAWTGPELPTTIKTTVEQETVTETPAEQERTTETRAEQERTTETRAEQEPTTETLGEQETTKGNSILVPTTESKPTTEGKAPVVPTTENKQTPTVRETIQVTAALTETTTRETQTPSSGHVTDKTTRDDAIAKTPTPPSVTEKVNNGKDSGEAYKLDMVALLGSIIVLEILLIIIVVMIIAYVKTNRGK